MNLRVRMDIGAFRAPQLRMQARDYMVRAVLCKQATHDRDRQGVQNQICVRCGCGCSRRPP